MSTQLTSIRDAIVRLESQLERLHERRSELRVAFEIKEDPTDSHKEELETQLAARLSVEGELAQARKQVEETEFKTREEERRRGELDAQLQRVQGELESQRLSAQEISTLSGTIEEQIKEKQGDLPILLETLPEDADLVDWEEPVSYTHLTLPTIYSV